MQGVYVITHKATGGMYIGSTTDLGRRMREHVSRLESQTHPVQSLQEAFNESPNLDWMTFPTSSIDEARDLEKVKIKELGENNTLFNTTYHLPMSDERKEMHSQLRMGVPHSDETRDKMSKARLGKKKSPEWSDKIADSSRKPIVVDGVFYRSATEAGEAHGVSGKTAARRAENPRPKHSNWSFANK